MGAVLDLSILGPFEVRVDRGEAVALGGLRQRALLALLILHAGEVVASDRLIDELWGETPPPTALHTIQVFVSRLRGALGDASERLVTRPPGYVFKVELDELDADRCEHLYATGRAALAGGDAARAAVLLREAQGLWRGSPLADFTYELFAQAAIARLEELRLSCQEELIEAELTLGQHARLIPELEALVREQPFRERLREQLMLALYRCGRQADALDAFQQARHKLLEELGVEPSAALRELEQAILRQDASLTAPVAVRTEPRPAPSDSGAEPDDSDAAPAAREATLPPVLRATTTIPYVGRAEEEQLAQRAIDHARDGQRRILVIAGEPGVGKTRLAARTALEAFTGGFSISWATTTEGMGAPYAIWSTALGHLIAHAPRTVLAPLATRHGGELARLVPSLADRVGQISEPRRSDPETERYLVFQAVIALLEALSGAAPLALVLDDLQWADAPSLALLGHVAAATAHLPLLLIGTYRDTDIDSEHPLGDTLAALRRVEGADRLTLHGLSSDEVAALMTEVAGHQLEAAELELAAEIASETGGNPFFVVQILRHLNERGIFAQAEDGRWRARRLDEVAIPPSAREVAVGRVRRLGRDAQSVLTVAAVVGEEFDVGLLERVVDQDEDGVLDALEAAVRASVLVESAESLGRFTFAHALFRNSLYEELGATRRARIHRQVAEAIEQLAAGGLDTHAPELAHHWLAARSHPEKAIGYAHRAGEQALAQLAPDHALHWFTEALALLPSDGREDEIRCDLLIGLGEARRQVGDASFRECLLEASALAERLDDPDRMTRAVLANTLGPLGAAGPPDHDRIGALEQALEHLGPGAPHVALVQAILAKEIYYGGDPHRGVELGEQALSLARQGSDRRELGRVLSFATAISPISALEQHEDRVRELGELGEEFADPELQFRAANMRFIHAMHSGERDALDAGLALMLTLAEAIGQPVLRWTALWAQSAHQWIAGDLSAAERLTMTAAATARAHNIPEGSLITFGQLLAVRTEQGRLDELIEPLSRQLEHNPGLRLLQLTRGFVLAETGRRNEAAAVLADLAQDGYRFEFDRTRAFNLARCADIALRVGDLDAAPRLYEALLESRRQFATPAGIATRGSIELSLGRLASALGREAAAEAHLQAAMRAHRAFGAPLLEARTHLALGEALRAPQHLREAAALAHRHGSVAIEREATSLAEAPDELSTLSAGSATGGRS